MSKNGNSASRHAKPTAQQLANRTYRKMVAAANMTEAQNMRIHLTLEKYYEGIAEMCRRIGAVEKLLNGHVKTLTEHCERLLREKETLQKAVDVIKADPLFSGLCFGQSWSGRQPTAGSCG